MRYGDVQPPPAVPPVGASPCPAVLPETVRLPPAGRVTSTRRAWAFGEAGMVTSKTPSASPAVRCSEPTPSPRESYRVNTSWPPARNTRPITYICHSSIARLRSHRR